MNEYNVVFKAKDKRVNISVKVFWRKILEEDIEKTFKSGYLVVHNTTELHLKLLCLFSVKPTNVTHRQLQLQHVC